MLFSVAHQTEGGPFTCTQLGFCGFLAGEMLDWPLAHWKLLIYRKRRQQLCIQFVLFSAHMFQLQVT